MNKDLYRFTCLFLAFSATVCFTGCSSKHNDESSSLDAEPDLGRTGIYAEGGPSTLDELVWRFEAGGEIGSSPALTKSSVLFGTRDGNLYSLNTENASLNWKFATLKGSFPKLFTEGHEVRSTPVIVGSNAYFGAYDGRFYSVNVESGIENWNFPTGGPILSTPAVVNNIAYFGSEDSRLYAVNIKTGQEKWRFEAEDSISSAPAIMDGLIYFKSNDFNLYCISLETGIEQWAFRTKDRKISDPAVSNGKVYFGCYDGDGTFLYALDAKDATILWKYKAVIFIRQAPTIINDTILASAADRLVALDAFGKEKWSFQALSNITTQASVSGRTAYFGTSDGTLYAIDIKTGQKSWQFKSEKRIASHPVIHKNFVFFCSDDKYIYKLK